MSDPTGTVVNLRIARKRRARVEREMKAELNRAAHGRSRTEREVASIEGDRLSRELDGARREPE